jgi:preprotein translocase subunit SecA
MIDPVSALATASSAFSLIKKGFEVGRDIEQMAGDISRWMSAMSDLSEAEHQAKNPPIFKKLFAGKSVEQEAIEIFAAKKKAERMREELRQYISWTMGQSAWDELIRMEGQIRKQRQETLYAQARRRRKFIEILSIILATGIGAGLLITFILALKALS